jgi:hypothetical protein
MSQPEAFPATLLDEIVPTYDARSRHTIRVAADPARVYAAARDVDLGSTWLVRLLMGVRLIPAWVAGARGPLVSLPRFTVVAEAPGEEFVLGIMGRFWTPAGGLVIASPEQFRLMPPAGLAQGIWNFRVKPNGTGTELSTETRVRCADEATRRQFRRYWRVIRLGSGLMRRSMLRHIRSEAEGRATHEGGQ